MTWTGRYADGGSPRRNGSGADAHRQPADYGADMCTPFEESSSGYLPLK
jgi:hypothetical protein